MLDYSQQQHWPNGFGTQQSPIMLSMHQSQPEQQPFSFNVQKPYLLKTLIDDQTTIRLTGQGASTIFGQKFNFQQVHLHAPAEHQVDGQQTPFEIHLVHQNSIGQLLVIGALVRLGAADETLDAILNQFQANAERQVQIDPSTWTTRLGGHGFHYLPGFVDHATANGGSGMGCFRPFNDYDKC